MSNRIFNQEQIKSLLQNPSVANCSEKSISYHKKFKVSAIKKYQEGLPPSEIFIQAQFDIDVIGHKTPKECLFRWKKILKNKGVTGLRTDGRGKHKSSGRPKNPANLSDEEKLKRLEAEVAYLKEENRFLAKLRKQSLN